MTTGDELAAAVQARHEADRLTRQLADAERRAEHSAAAADEAARQLSQEQRDVDRHESLSWSRILSTLKGSHLTDLEREQAERDRARYESAVAGTRADADRAEVASIREQLTGLGDVDAAYAAALDAHERWALVHDPSHAARLEELALERGRLADETREVTEAIDAGAAAHQHLVGAERLLASAQSWSTWDTFFGGGMLTDAVKYDKLDQVNRELEHAASALRQFSRELADLDLPTVSTVDIGRLGQAFDFFFDNIFSDLMVRDRISTALTRTRENVGRVRTVVEQLSVRRTDLEAHAQTLDTERATLLGA